jgi:hypothetical protein
MIALRIVLASLAVCHAMGIGPGDRPGPHFPCDQSRVRACVDSHRGAQQAELAAAAALDGKIALLTKDQQALQARQETAAAELRSVEATIRMSQKEADFLQAPAQAPEKEIFPGGPGPGSVKDLEGPSMVWGELHGPSRRARLLALIDLEQSKAREESPILQNLAMQISGLGGQIQAAQAERANHSANAAQHAKMCDGGCRIEVCPGL